MSAAVMLSDVAELVMGQSPPSTSYNDAGDGLPFYQGKTDFGATYPTPRIYCREPRKLAESGDILMSVRAPVGATNLCSSQSCIGRGIAAIRANGIDRDFLYFYLKKIETYIDSLGSGAIFKAINKSQLAELPINEAGIPLPEQKKIAHILSTIQRAIEAQERIIQTTTELKKALMHKLFTEGLRNEPQKQTEIGLIPESWEITRVDSVFEIQQGKQVSKKNRVGKNQKPFLRTKNVFWNRLDLKKLDQMNFSKSEEARLEMHLGDLLLCEGGDVGRTAMWTGEIESCYYQNHLHRLRAIPERILSQYGVYWFWRAFKFSNLYFGRGNVTTIPNLSRSRLSELPVALPPIEEQSNIARILDSCEAKTSNATHKVEVLQNLFRSLLHGLMTAKTRVSNTN